MATFKDRIEDLAGTIPATADGEQFLKDGVVDVVHRTISAHPQHMSLFSKEQSIESAGSSVHDVHVSEVTRSGTACREIPAAGRHAAADTNSLHYASTDDPVYYFLNEKIHILPEGSGTCSILEHGDVISWDSGTSSITYMPSHHYNQVIMYAGIQTLHHKMVEMNSNTDIDTAFTAVNTELDETQASCDLINTQVDAAVVELAEAGTQVDESIDTALAAILTATGRINTAVGLANDEFDKCDTILDKGEVDSEGDVNTALGLVTTAVAQAATAASKFLSADESVFGDEETFLTANSQLTRVKNALDQASDVINGNQPSATTDAFGALVEEDTEILQGALAIVSSEIQRAQMHLAEWTSIGDMRVKEVNAALSEANGGIQEINARLAQAQSKREESNSRIASGNAYLQEAAMSAKEAETYAVEVNSRLAQVSGYGQVAGGYISAAQGYASEIQSKINIAQGYIGEINTRIARDNQTYQWYASQIAALQQQYNASFMVSGQQ